MIRRKWRESEAAAEGPKGFDDYDFRLGDQMRGERATMGKSLLDVQRELRIKASYIAAIENSDPSAFETPGFIAGYVRSYARYLGMSPDETFAKFCLESGFQTAHGMSAEASGKRKDDKVLIAPVDRDPFGSQNAPFLPAQDSILSRIEARAIGSSLVLLALISGIGYGGWSVLNEIQRVSLAPVEQTPVVLSDLDPLSDANAVTQSADASGVFTPPETQLDRLYRPQALDVPVLVARDAPISTLNPQSIGSFTPAPPVLQVAEVDIPIVPAIPQVLEEADPEVVMFAVRPAWVRVRSADGSVLFEKTMDAGEEFTVPATEMAPTLQAGMSGSIYFKLNGEIRGPAGAGSSVVRNLEIGIDAVQQDFAVADLSGDQALADFIAVAEAQTTDTAE
ncbi:helix-turn-helix domain-containing protein [Cognatishimia maritima]|uniref:Cytoskeleton protein RodZ-like C-terminal domain-containing protein n=1 Tax=Cognatishimia maritima TaxID=870908 RepID=A0A1M5IJ59_9RHOB|nr:helix-turn-helix domain-containing protein [Cognatishimia maritima]SHG28378.1 protein of unknown function [Cognatishimia maritima]